MLNGRDQMHGEFTLSIEDYIEADAAQSAALDQSTRFWRIQPPVCLMALVVLFICAYII